MPLLAEQTRQSQHGTWIEIRLDAFYHNLNALKKITGPDLPLLAVIKANAYGHGLLPIGEALENRAVYLGVANVQEALELKERDIKTPVFLFGRVFAEELPAVMSDGITLSVSSFNEAQEISTASENFKRRTKIHIKVDTGMGRLGIPLRHAFSEIEKIAALDHLELEGLYTHFPTAEQRDSFATQQIRDFSLLVKALDKKQIRFRYHHASNSAGTVRIKSSVLNLCRPGIMMYGIYPDLRLRELICLKPVLSLKSRIILLKYLQPGESVGYGREFVAKQPVYVATLPIGYSHGYPFQVGGKAFVLCKGIPCPVLGRVSMDYLCVDVSRAQPRLGDTVTLIGEESDEKITAEDVAGWAGTIPYEIVTRLTSRIPRLYQ